MKIGELASATDTRVETIRFYEREGLLPAPKRSTANYRVYTSAHAERLAFIRNCRNLDMALGEVRELLRFKDAPGKDCANVNALLEEHIGHVSQRIRELRVLEGNCGHCVRAAKGRVTARTAGFSAVWRARPAGLQRRPRSVMCAGRTEPAHSSVALPARTHFPQLRAA